MRRAYAILRVAVIPAAVVKNGRRTKIFWLFSTGAIFVSFGGYYLPVGPVWVILEMRKLFRRVAHIEAH